jgi:anti-anti-sigma factor
MAVLQNAGKGSADHGADPRGVTLSARHYHRATLVTIGGEVDASNGHHVLEFVRRFIYRGRVLVIDMRGVELFGAQGLAALFEIDGQCRAVGVDWAVVPSPWVGHLLRVGDADNALPLAQSVDEAVHRFRYTMHVDWLDRLLLDYE